MPKKEKIIRFIGVLICEAFAIITVFMLIDCKQYDKLFLAATTTLLVLLPEFAEKIFKCKISLPVYLICLFYAIGPMLGHSHNLYYLIPWWDKLLHILGGVMFAFLGLFLFEKFVGKDQKNIVMTAIFGLCFSRAIAVLWEFCEFGADTFLGMDMQDDVVVDHINSYLLDDGIGVAGSIANIDEVIVNGEKLPVKGYIDIGLTDSMLDMLLETVGAIIISGIYIISSGKFVVFKTKEGVA